MVFRDDLIKSVVYINGFRCFYDVFTPCSLRSREPTPEYPFPGGLIDRVRRVLSKYFSTYYLLYISHLPILLTYSVIDTQTYSNYAYTRPISFYTNKSGTKPVAKYSIYREKIAALEKRKRLIIRIPFIDVDPNI